MMRRLSSGYLERTFISEPTRVNLSSAGEARVKGADPEGLHLRLARGRELMGAMGETEDFATAACDR